MPDESGERIRKLKFPPAPAWGDRGPRTKTLREDIARWYENVPGGLDAAVAQAQEAIRENGGRPWDPAGLDAPSPYVMKDLSLDPTVPKSTLGYHDSSNDELALHQKLLADDLKRQQVLEHERSHRLYGDPKDDSPLLKGAPRYLTKQTSANYVTQPSEVEVRLAEIKRRYAHATGRLVDSPEEAKRALQWYGRRYDAMPTTGPDAGMNNAKGVAGEYLMLPEDDREKVFRRMMEVVQANSPQRFLG